MMEIWNTILHSFNEGYSNGFYSMQNWHETISSWFGADAFVMLHPTWSNFVEFVNDTVNVIQGKY